MSESAPLIPPAEIVEIVENPKVLAAFWEAYGIITVLDALDKISERDRIGAGFALAKAVAEKVSANQKVELQRRIMGAVAKAGHDLTVVNIITEWRGSIPYLKVVPLPDEGAK